MAEIQAKGSITLTRIVDGRTINFCLSPSLATTQVISKDPKGYLPDYTKTSMVITPILTVSGNGGENQVKGTCVWTVNGVNATTDTTSYTVQTSGDYALVIKKNPSVANTLVTCTYTYTGEGGLKSDVSASINLTQVENAGTTIMAMITPSETIFRNVGGEPTTITLTGQMLRGADLDAKDVSYKWYISGMDGNMYAITGATAPTGSGLPSGNLFTGAGTNVLTINSDAILNIGNIRLEVTDTDPESTTSGKTVAAVVSILDATDPYDLDISCAKGTAMSASSTGLPVTIAIVQKGQVMGTSFYDGATITFWRETPAGGKDSTFAPAASDFSGWTITSGTLSRSYSSGNGTDANRTLTIKPKHLREEQNTTYSATFNKA